ncbi:ABC transporter ATP-binding protein [Demequina mangrovi]|uniref:ABC-2 type transport system ATP-binding protein/ribosome-dependent ATPase n=1 Tax=Demequina mangrovi TaxID=1043493 RepID=A0A1H7ANS0_9MICO|nr:ATP-binding cassette domain-containing protein [Demequina mangrovi]SEJ63712.1 ABC-2 type transport system ATP-binding protein/ribosome-dependent ATPase [Demequina mangrovi]
MAEPLIHAQDVTRRFGDFTAVDGVSISVAAGEIVGLLGANGAGKTTLIRMILGLLPPSDGALALFGAPPSREGRARLGYVPQGLGLWDDLTVAENLAFVDQAFGSRATAVPDALAGSRDGLVGGIGLGRQRQLAFAAALGHGPELLVLDEPTSGVDPLSRARLWDTVHESAEQGVGVLVTTHYMQEAEQCDRLVLMSQGRAVGEGQLADIVAGTTALAVRTERWQDAFEALDRAGVLVMLSGTHVRAVDADEVRVRAALGGLAAEVEPVGATLEEAMVARERSAG